MEDFVSKYGKFILSNSPSMGNPPINTGLCGSLTLRAKFDDESLSKTIAISFVTTRFVPVLLRLSWVRLSTSLGFVRSIL